MGKFEELFEEKGDDVEGQTKKKRVGSYVLGRILGEGSFAKVRLAVHLLSMERVAVKVVNKHSVKKRDNAKRNLHREAGMLQRLSHPNIIQLYEVMETDNHYYIVTELADGYDFMGYISERQSLPERESQRYMRQIVTAVDHMHQSGVIHRDLKIENFMLDRNMNIKIIDFGLGNVWDGQNPLTTQCGSPAYAAPEIFSKRPYSTTVDIWSIGVNLYAMLTGSLPFTTDPPNNLKRLHAAILKGCDPPSNITPECKDVLLNLLETDENKRIKMTELKEHPWIRGNLGPVEIVGLKTKPLTSDIDNIVINHMVKKLGMDEEQIKDSILNNKVNAFSATYQLLCKRKVKGLEGIPGMPREFLAQTTSRADMGSLKQGEVPHTSKVGGPVSPRHSGIDNERVLQRKQMVSTNLSQVGHHKQNAIPSLRSRGDRLEHNIQHPAPPERMKQNSAGVREGPLDTYKDCLSKLRSHRDRPNRSILKSEGGTRPMKLLKVYGEPPPAPPASSAGSECRETLTDMESIENDHALTVPHNDLRSNSASTKSVRFKLEPDTTNEDLSTVLSYQNQGLPSQMERLILRRLSADKSKRDNILGMSKVLSSKNHWEINQDAIDTLKKRASPEMSLLRTGSGRMRAMRVIKRSESAVHKVPPTPPNSALARHLLPNRFVSSAAGRERSTSSGNSKGRRYLHDANIPNGLTMSRSRQSELMDVNTNTADEKQYGNYQFRVRKDGGSAVLVWDLKILDIADNAGNPETLHSSGLASPDPNMRKLGTLRSQVVINHKQPHSEVTDNINSMKSLCTLPDPGSRGLPPRPASRLDTLEKKPVGVNVPPPPGQTVKLRLRPVRNSTLRSLQDAQTLPIKGSDTFTAK